MNKQLKNLIVKTKMALQIASKMDLEFFGNEIYLLYGKKNLNKLAKKCNLKASILKKHLTKIKNKTLKIAVNEKEGIIKIIKK